MPASTSHRPIDRPKERLHRPALSKRAYSLRPRSVRFRRRWRMAVPIALAIALTIQFALRLGVVTPADSPTIQAQGLQSETHKRANQVPDEELNYLEDSAIDAGQRIVEIDRPGGLGLAHEGAIVEVVRIGNGEGTISAVPIASGALVVARSDTTASLLVTEFEALEILESQALGSVALLAVGEPVD